MHVALLTRTITFRNGAVVPYLLDMCATLEIAQERAEMGRREVISWLEAKTELGCTIHEVLLRLGYHAIEFDAHPGGEVRTTNLSVPKPVIIMPGNGRG